MSSLATVQATTQWQQSKQASRNRSSDKDDGKDFRINTRIDKILIKKAYLCKAAAEKTGGLQ
jgi:hypothetical protein